jgi:hypothetical protein
MSETQDILEESELLPFDHKGPGAIESLSLANVRYIKELISNAKDSRNSYLETVKETEENKNIFAEDEIKNLFSFRKSFADLDYKYRLDIFDKIKNSGLPALIEQVGGIREFARKRFSNDEFLRRISCKY